MNEPVTNAWEQYRNLWVPWLWLAAGWAVVVVLELGVIAVALLRRR